MKLLSGISKLFRHPRHRYVYAVTAGDYMGEFLVYIETVDNVFCFLSLPDMKIRKIPEIDTKSAIDLDLLDVVEKLPSDIYCVCCEQYRNNDKNHGTGGNVPSNIPSHT